MFCLLTQVLSPGGILASYAARQRNRRETTKTKGIRTAYGVGAPVPSPLPPSPSALAGLPGGGIV